MLKPEDSCCASVSFEFLDADNKVAESSEILTFLTWGQKTCVRYHSTVAAVILKLLPQRQLTKYCYLM